MLLNLKVQIDKTNLKKIDNKIKPTKKILVYLIKLNTVVNLTLFKFSFTKRTLIIKTTNKTKAE